jgi:hypothetical protein
MKNNNILLGVAGLALSLGAIYVYAYTAGKGWKASQK